jgi:Cd2+/Zn2+-exporting ATPase
MEAEKIALREENIPGTVVYIAVGGIYAGYIVISDEIKPDSVEAVKKLKEIGVRKTVMLTGDSKATGESVGKAIGIDEVYAGLLPQQKVEKMEELSRNVKDGGKVVFVGDGINDAPVLARADVGVAMGGLGSDAAIEAADIVIMTDEPSKLADAISIARRTRRIVWQNIIFALGVKAVFLTLGAFGIATMWEAVFGDVGVTVIAVLNAARTMRTSGVLR